MPTTLYYFDGRGLAEPIRIILALGDIEYEDVRIPLESIPAPIPPEIKAKCTWGQVPVLEIDGKRICQSLAITRYFAKKVGVAGKDAFESAQCDEYVDTVRELMTLSVPAVYEKDASKVPDLVETLKKSSKEKYLNKFESIVQGNGTGWLVGDSMTWADIYLAHVLNNVKLVLGADLLTVEHPSLQKLVKNVMENPKIKNWIEKRPQTKY